MNLRVSGKNMTIDNDEKKKSPAQDVLALALVALLN